MQLDIVSHMNIEIFKRENAGSFSRIKIGKINVMDTIWDRKSFKVGGHFFEISSVFVCVVFHLLTVTTYIHLYII